MPNMVIVDSVRANRLDHGDIAAISDMWQLGDELREALTKMAEALDNGQDVGIYTVSSKWPEYVKVD